MTGNNNSSIDFNIKLKHQDFRQCWIVKDASSFVVVVVRFILFRSSVSMCSTNWNAIVTVSIGSWTPKKWLSKTQHIYSKVASPRFFSRSSSLQTIAWLFYYWIFDILVNCFSFQFIFSLFLCYLRNDFTTYDLVRRRRRRRKCTLTYTCVGLGACDWLTVCVCVFFGLIDSLFSTEHVSSFALFAFVDIVVVVVAFVHSQSPSMPSLSSREEKWNFDKYETMICFKSLQYK